MVGSARFKDELLDELRQCFPNPSKVNDVTLEKLYALSLAYMDARKRRVFVDSVGKREVKHYRWVKNKLNVSVSTRNVYEGELDSSSVFRGEYFLGSGSVKHFLCEGNVYELLVKTETSRKFKNEFQRLLKALRVSGESLIADFIENDYTNSPLGRSIHEENFYFFDSVDRIFDYRVFVGSL